MFLNTTTFAVLTSSPVAHPFCHKTTAVTSPSCSYITTIIFRSTYLYVSNAFLAYRRETPCNDSLSFELLHRCATRSVCSSFISVSQSLRFLLNENDHICEIAIWFETFDQNLLNVNLPSVEYSSLSLYQSNQSIYLTNIWYWELIKVFIDDHLFASCECFSYLFFFIKGTK